MKALLLAAGKGTRISRYLNGAPKCTVDIGNGLPLVRYTVDLLRRKGITDIAIVTGYSHEAIEQLFEGEDIRFYYTPFFNVTNSIVSAWFAREFLTDDDDLLVMNADVFCEEALYDAVLDVKENPVMLYDTGRRENADYKFFCEDGKIKKYGKELTLEETSGEYIGMAKMSKDFLPVFRRRLEEMISTQQSDVWWENVLYSMTDSLDIHALDMKGYFWAEVDYIEDYQRIVEHCKVHLFGK